MSRLGEWCAVLLVGLAAWSGRAAGDEVARYLEHHGLSELLAVHLETALESADAEQREELRSRLAGIYAQLLEQVSDEARREELVARSRRLVAAAPAEQTGRLRLALLRASYRSAEKIAEHHRLRLAPASEVEQARETLSEIIPGLQQLQEQLDNQAEKLERRLARGSRARARAQAVEIEELRRLGGECTFLRAWSLYYQSWLHDRSGTARAAEALFGELLALGREAAVPENVSIDLRATESIARGILGMALCKSLTASTATAIAWVELLEHERTYEAVRAEAPAWKMAVYLEGGEYASARAVLEQYLAAGGSASVSWLRLLAVHALEAAGEHRGASELARYAVTELAARGELAQVFDLAQRYGVESLGAGGFALRYVTGVIAYYEARERHGDDEPARDEAVMELYADAAATIERARREADAADYPSAQADCLRLIGWCHYFRGDFAAAARWFEDAASCLGSDEAPDALWMAIVSLDRLVQGEADDAEAADRLSRLTARFLEMYPSSPQAPKLVLRRALTTAEVSPEAAEELLAIPPNSEVYAAARRRAAQILYRLFREAEGVERAALGTRYLGVAGPLQASVELELDPSDSPAVARFLVRARRMLEVALDGEVLRLDAARAAFNSLARLRAMSRPDVDAIESEITYRRVQARLLADDVAEARRLADGLWTADSEDVWSRLAVRAVYRYGRARWQEARREGADDRPFVALVIDYGRRVVAEYADEPSALVNPAVQALYAVVAEASFVVWRRSGDLAEARVAFELYERLLEVRPRSAGFLRSIGFLSEELDKPERAVQCWRTLVAGSEAETEAWYEAKYHLIATLAELDAARARAVMEQHRQLHPEYGPLPWGPKLEALDAELRAAAGTAGRLSEESGP